MKHTLFLLLLTLPFALLSCNKDDHAKDAPPYPDYETIAGNMYVYYNGGSNYTVYTFNADGTFSCQRIREENRKWVTSSYNVGCYEYNHPDLKISHSCLPDSYNSAEVDDIRRSFTITYFTDLRELFLVYDYYSNDYMQKYMMQIDSLINKRPDSF